MDKLKKVFSPGASKDDEVLYGDEHSRKASAATASGQNTAPLHTTPGNEKESGGVMRQILNPGGEKYDSQLAHGTTASTEAQPHALGTQSGHKDNTISQQILNPAGEKYDPDRFDSTGGVGASDPSHARATDTLETDAAEKKNAPGVLRQILNPRGQNYNPEGFGNTAHVVGDSSSSGNTAQHTPATGGTLGSTTQQSASNITPGHNTTGDSSHLGRDAAVAGTGVAGYEAAKHKDHHHHHNQPTESSRTDPTTTTRHHHTTDTTTSQATEPTRQAEKGSHLRRDAAIGTGVAGGAAAAHHHHHKNKDEPITSHPGQTTAGSAVNSGISQPYQSTTGDTLSKGNTSSIDPTRETGHSSHLGRDAAIGTGVAAVGGVAAHEAHRHHTDNARDKDEFGRPVQSHHNTTGNNLTSGSSNPSNTTTGNVLSSGNTSSVDPTRETGHSSHLGRDAAIGTGVAGAGAAAYGHHHNQHDPSHQHGSTTGNTLTSGSSNPSHSTTGNVLSSGNTSSIDPTRETGHSSHLGRDAAIGAGVAGAGAAAYGHHHNQHDPSHQHGSTTGSGLDSGSVNPSTYNTLNSGTSDPARSGPTGTAAGSNHREAAVVGGTGLAGGLAAHELGNRHGEHSGLSQHAPTSNSHTATGGAPTSESIIDRPHPLAGGTSADTSASTMFGGQGADHERGIHQPGTGHDSSTTSHNTAGLGAGALAGGVAGSQLNRPHDTTDTTRGLGGTSQNTAGLGAGAGGLTGTAASTGSANEGWAPHVHKGPHKVDYANVLDPHVPGEFPTEGGEDRHSHTGRDLAAGTAAGAATGAGVGALASGHGSSHTGRDSALQTATGPGASTGTASGITSSNLSSQGPTSTTTTGSYAGDGQHSHTGRDVAAGTAAGVGAGALASGLSGHGSSQRAADSATTSGSHLGEGRPITTTTNTRSPGQTSGTGATSGLTSHDPSSSITTNTPSHGHSSTNTGHGSTHATPEHHTNRTLGVLGGPMAGATLGGPELEADDNLSSGKHSKSTGHHEGSQHHGRDAGLAAGAGAAGVGAYEANKSTGPASKTTGPHQSDVMNVVDPRVQPSSQTIHNAQSDKSTSHGVTGAAAGATAANDHHDHEKHHHNKLQKARPEDEEHGEKKPSLIHRILHPGESKKEHHSTSSSRDTESAHHPSSTTASSTAQSQATDAEGRVIDPHTGLPMNVEKYGSGVGGTDGSSTIPGYHQTGDSATGGQQGPDWEAVRKANTPY